MTRASSPASLRACLVAVALLVALLGLGHPAAFAADDADTTSDTSTTDDTTVEEAPTDSTENRSRADSDERGKRSDEAAGHAEEGTDGTSGETTEEQPLSTADENEGGANGDCPEGEYCSTRDGSESENGAGDGEATGKPCAGCVGKADNKNPQGQLPDADSDGNAGYECDINQGVGQGNPAHTACTSVGELPVDGFGGGPAEVSPEVAGVVTEDAVIAGVEAFAGPHVAAAVERAGVAALVAPVAGILPATGSGPLLWAAGIAGLLMLVVGTTLVRRRALA